MKASEFLKAVVGLQNHCTELIEARAGDEVLYSSLIYIFW
jgi:hypothetical protein